MPVIQWPARETDTDGFNRLKSERDHDGIPFCWDCRFYSAGVCHHETNYYFNVVSGRPETRNTVGYLRDTVIHPVNGRELCGPSGKYFEPKDAA